MTMEAFEAEARKHGFILDRLDKSGVYVQLITEQAWIMWQAATNAALERADDICDAINADYTARYAAPAWHDAPTVPGVWVNSETWMSYNHDGLGKPIPGRRYGPIPADKE